MDRSLLVWLLFLGLGFPLTALVLNEVAERLQQREHPLAEALQKIRQYVLPPLAILLLLTKVLELANAQGATRLVETVTYIAVITAAIPLLNAVLTTGKPIAGQIKVPNLFFQVARALVILGIGYYILGGVWQIDLSSLATAAGVSSLAIALALQDTLSNLVSGFLLLFARPFQIGDWIEFNGVEGQVFAQNWRSVTLWDKGWGRYISIPNGTLAGATINNYGPMYENGVWFKVDISFSYDDPPNRVLDALWNMQVGIEDRLTEPLFPVVHSFGDSGINYIVWFRKSARGGNAAVKRGIISGLYNLAQREGFTIPYPISMEYKIDAANGLPSKIPHQVQDLSPELADFLGTLPYFSKLQKSEMERIVNLAKVRNYSKGELIIKEGAPDDGLYLVREGSVSVSTQDKNGESQDCGSLSVGEAFGEMAIFPEELSPVTVIAAADSQIVMIPVDEIVRLIQGGPQFLHNSGFSKEMLQFIYERKRALRRAKGMDEDVIPQSSNSNGSERFQYISQRSGPET